MPAGSKIQPEIHAVITAHSLKDLKEPRTQVAERIERHLDIMDWRVPERTTIEKEISNARTAHISINRAQQNNPDLDNPFYLGVLSNPIAQEITPSGISKILEVQGWCLASETTITLRQAIWVSRLSEIQTISGLGRLYLYAYDYALKELINQALANKGLTINTADLDARLLSFRKWEQYTIRELEFIKTDAWRLGSLDLKIYPYASWIVQERLNLLAVRDSDGVDIGMLSLDDTADRVFAYWIRFLSEGPLWDHLHLDRKISILRAVGIKIQQMENSAELDEASKHPFLPGSFYKELLLRDLPTQILREVGYDD